MDKFVLKLKLLKVFLSFSIDLELNPNEELKSLIWDLNYVSCFVLGLRQIIENFLKKEIENIKKIDFTQFYKEIDYDEISFNIIFPKEKKGISSIFHFPKLTEILNEKINLYTS